MKHSFTRFYEEKDGVVNKGSSSVSSPSKPVSSSTSNSNSNHTMDRRGLRFAPPPFSPLMGFGRSFFDDAELDRSFARPYWTDNTMFSGHRLGDGVADVVDNETEFKFTVDVSQFEPEELKVNIVDNDLVIEAKHDEKSDRYGTISRQFSRKFRLTPTVKPEEVKSELSKEGHLTVRFEKEKPSGNVKKIPITIQKH